MPLELTYNKETGVFTITGSEKFLFSDATQIIEKLYNAPEFGTPFRVLWDLRESGLGLTSLEIKQISSFVMRKRPENSGRIAILVSSLAAYGLARMFEISTSLKGAQIMVFRNADEADKWLMYNG